MFPFHLFRSFLPLHNPIGFGASDFIELVLTAMLVLLVLAWRAWIESFGTKLAERTGWCMLLLAALPVALRLLLLPQHPAPTPNTSDDFSYLLVADTLLHFRLANPPHALHPFFETFFVLQEPSYSSIFPIGQGIALALGRILFGHPWAGVLLSVAALCALCYWMLRAWTTPGWALLGGLLAAMQFGPLNQWTNCYWGGAVSAIAGCLVFGAASRSLADPRRRPAGPGARHAVAHPPVRVLLTARECAAVLSAVGAPTGRAAGARASPSSGGAGRAARHPLDARPQQAGHGQLDHLAL
jgi:hypothetical protein